MPVDHFGEDVAASYDDSAGDWFDPAVVDPAVERLAALAGDGPVLELGVGTGRIALPLARRGLAVHGIDLSTAMVARLKAKPGGDAIDVTIGDFASTFVGARFTLVYIVFNTIMNLTTQDEQVACVANAASHLVGGGHFVVEVMVPELRRLPPGGPLLAQHVAPDHVLVDEYDVVDQGLVSHHYAPEDGGGFIAHPLPCRYVWPAELDLMARLAGMRLETRLGGFDGTPFTSSSASHVSIYARPR